MTRYASVCELPVAMREQVKAHLAPRVAKPSKYRNVRTTVDGQSFDSKAEAKYYQNLRLRQFAGEVAWFIRQPSFRLTGGVRYRADFLVVLTVGGVDVVDVKGMLTRATANKIKQVEELYGIRVRLWPER